MEAKEAARLAKKYIAELLADEGAQHIGLEEIEYDNLAGLWRVTVGFSRPWADINDNPLVSFADAIGPRKRVRDMKVVSLEDDTGSVRSVKNRE